MISWIWLIPAFIAGALFAGFYIAYSESHNA